jgi:flagellar hook-associated protein 1 FlgK
MAVGFSSYEIARSGLFVNERGLFVTGHNLSNVNTSGYVRQQAVIATAQYITEPSKYGILQYGLGADIQQIRQIRHTFLDNIYRQENTTLGYWEARNKTFEDIQAILGEPMSSGLQSVMNQFWDSWQELSKEPDSLTVRALVRQRAEALVHHFNHLGAQLDKLQTDLNSEVRVRIEEVNQITEQIAKLNLAILRNEVSGDTANDYRDQRNTLVDRLSKLVNAEVTEMQDGQLDITVGGYILVTKGQHTRVSAGESRPGMIFNSMKLEGTDIVVPLRSGIIKGLMESRGEVPGAKGSILNGTPNTKADIVFVVDVSDSSDDAFLADLKANIANSRVHITGCCKACAKTCSSACHWPHSHRAGSISSRHLCHLLPKGFILCE